MSETTEGPLAGLLVADFSRVVAGPFATMLLGDLGADVVKVERPGSGDDTRGYGPPFLEGGSAYYLSVNRNKRSVAWDLSTEPGIAKARALARRADVLVENFKPGTATRMGLGYEALAAANPGLVYCSVSGFGSTGSGAAMPGYDFLVQAVGGLMSITGDEGGQPLKIGVALVDVLTALFACNAILAAVVERAASGRGQHVEVDLLSCSLAALINQASTFVTTGHVPHAMGNRHPSIAPYESLQAADREMVVTVGNDGQFAAMAQVIGEGWMAGDERFAGNAARIANRREMTVILESALARRPAAEWVTLLMAAGVPSGVVNGIDEAFALAERIGLQPVVGSSAGVPDERAQVADPMRLDRTPVSYRTAPPRLGEHTDEVERELGLA